MNHNDFEINIVDIYIWAIKMNDYRMAGPVTHENDKKYPKILFRQPGTQRPSENKRWIYVCQITKSVGPLRYTKFVNKQHIFPFLSSTH